MTVIVKPNADLVVPRSVSRRAGIKAGDRLEFKVSSGAINIVRKLTSANDEYTPRQRRMNDEYTPRQRRMIDKALAEGMDDIQKGRLHGPFETHTAMIEFLHHQTNNAQGKSKRQPKG